MKRPIRIEGSIAIVPLTKGYEAVIDIEDLALVDGKNWTAWVSRNLGRFIEKTDAETAVKKARAELHGAFANNGTQGVSNHGKKASR